MLMSLWHEPADERLPQRPVVRFQVPLSETDGQLPFRLSSGTRLLVRFEAGQRLVFQLPDRMSRRTAVISPFFTLIRPRKSTLKIKKMTPAGPEDLLCAIIQADRRRIVSTPVYGLDGGAAYSGFKKMAGKVRLVIMDGASRLTPWSGNRFDPLANGLIQFIEALSRDNPRLILLALADGVGAAARRDIMARLGLTGEAGRAGQRPETIAHSFQIIQVLGQDQKAALYSQILHQDIPAAIGEAAASGTVFAPAPPGSRSGLEIQMLGSDPGKMPVNNKAIPLVVPSYQPLYCHPRHRPANALEAPFPEKTRSRFHDFMVASEAGEKQPSWGRFVLDIALDGGLDRWRLMVLSGGNRHGVHLADLPSETCEADMASRGCPVPQCDAGKCPWDKPDLCDYGLRHAAIQQFIPDPATETLDVLKMLDRIIAVYEEGADILQIHSGVDNRSDAMALERLSDIGLIADFQALYLGGFKIVGFNPAVQAQDIMAAAQSWQKRLGFPLNSSTRQSDLIQKKWRSAIHSPLQAAMDRGDLCRHLKYDRLFKDSAPILMSILAPFAHCLKDMAYRTLWNLKTFLKSDRCRQATLIRHWLPVSPEWRCGRCDNCTPTLADVNYPLSSGAPWGCPAHHGRSHELSEADTLDAWLGADACKGRPYNFDPEDTMPALLKDDPEYVYQRSSIVLEGDPSNIRALYLARESAPEAAVNLTNRYLFRSICDQEMPFFLVQRLWEGVTESARPLVFDILDNALGPANCPEGERLLYRNAKKLSLAKNRIKQLRARCAVTALADIDFTAWKTRLSKYLENFPSTQEANSVKAEDL